MTELKTDFKLYLNDEMATAIMESLKNPPEPSAFLLNAKALYDSDVNVPRKQVNHD